MKISPAKKRHLSFFSVYFTFFLDNFGWALVVPIFAPLFLENGMFFSEETSLGTKTVMLGIFLGAYPFAQFLAAPFIGEYADKKGRKKSFILTIGSTCAGYIISALGIEMKLLFLVFLGRIITGLFAGNLSICLASIADLTEEKETKSHKFGFLSVLAGASFILGTFIGGNLSDSSIYPFFSPVLPFWAAALLCFINLLFVMMFFSEPARVLTKLRYKFSESFKNISLTLKNEELKKIFFVYFLFYLSWNFLFQFGPVLMFKKFNFSYSSIGNLSAFMGICWALGSGIFHKRLIMKFSKQKVLITSLFIFVIPFILIGYIDQVLYVIFLISLCALVGGIVWPIFNSIVSDSARFSMQGRTLAINQSMQSLSTAIAPILGGYAAEISLAMPFVLASLISIMSLIIYFTRKT